METDINTYLMITKEIKLLGSNGGSVEDLKGVYDCFETGKMNPQLITIPFEEVDKGLEKLKNHEGNRRTQAETDENDGNRRKLMETDGN